jgi:hypothetical protein
MRKPLRDDHDKWRDDWMTTPSVSGRPANNADIVVIMIGRKRNQHASWIASIGDLP